ncbi:hypothetical protein [uncultured Acinetobacter sp.]|uniref:hypothetical protein n=1 Tax=uncultured Acinetobacter sp. TaxID=165433 RepID=UPI0026108910|nr:hypothetical protein [uncultured Acinetobacter sp.]
MSFNDALANAIKGMALVADDEARKKLKEDALANSLDDWKIGLKMKVGGVGGLTGVLGGPVGLLLEGADIAYLLASCGQACYGIGHIKGRNIDYNIDIPIILAIWAGAAEASMYTVAGKSAMKIGGKVAIKSGVVIGSQLLGKVIPKVAAKIGAKLASKVSTKWIPIIGGIVSAGINIWVADGLLDAAEKYYSNNYVILDSDLSAIIDTALDAKDVFFDN